MFKSSLTSKERENMADEQEKAADSVKLQFHYIKAPGYHEIACHGVIGGVTPQNKIWMGLFTERYPLPRTVEFTLPPAPEGMVQFDEANAQPSHMDTRTGLIRHVEVGAYFDLSIAERLRDWLDKQIVKSKTGAES
jgi:hypothetical protein